MTKLIRLIPAAELEFLAPTLGELLVRTVVGGASLGFVPPLTHETARQYWHSLRPELQAESRLLMGAFVDNRLVGSAQLMLPLWPNAIHRAEVQKVFVHDAVRGQGAGRALMEALHDEARLRGRTLVLLNARQGGIAERFYRTLGYREAGVIPGYMLGPAGRRINSVTMYQELAS